MLLLLNSNNNQNLNNLEADVHCVSELELVCGLRRREEVINLLMMLYKTQIVENLEDNDDASLQIHYSRYCHLIEILSGET